MSTDGLWSEEERTHHATKTFTKGRMNIHVLIRMDKTMSIAYINKMGGTRSHILSQVACDHWYWCLPAGDNPVSSTPAGRDELHS
jgi:hypothetical protein